MLLLSEDQVEATGEPSTLLYDDITPQGLVYDGPATKLLFSFWYPSFLPGDWVARLSKAIFDVLEDRFHLVVLSARIWTEKATLGKSVFVEVYFYDEAPAVISSSFAQELISTSVIILAILIVLGVAIATYALLAYTSTTWKGRNEALATINDADQKALFYEEQAAIAEANNEPEKTAAYRTLAKTFKTRADELRRKVPGVPKGILEGMGWTPIIIGGAVLAGMWLLSQRGPIFLGRGEK